MKCDVLCFNQKRKVSQRLDSLLNNNLGFPGGSDCKEYTCNAGDLGSIPGLGKIPWTWDKKKQQHYFQLPLNHLIGPWRAPALIRGQGTEWKPPAIQAIFTHPSRHPFTLAPHDIFIPPGPDILLQMSHPLQSVLLLERAENNNAS